MIFPDQCKYVGSASTHPCGNRVYFLSRYLIRATENGTELLEVVLDPEGKGMMRDIFSSQVIASGGEVFHYPEKVQIHDRALLIRLAHESGFRCTVFTSLEENRTFVLDPEPTSLLTIHIYDVIPPRPTLSASIRELEANGLFGELSVQFSHHIRDITTVPADAYPCRAAGYSHTLDADPMYGGERVAGCLTGSQFYTECYGTDFTLENICPLEQVIDEPFIARCCRAEREGIGTWNGMFGAIVHWGASPAMIARSVNDLVVRWRAK